MTDPRPPLPRPLKRAVEVEAGHRCAVPTCRATSGLQVHHIVDWAKVREHAIDNLILLCAICHARATNGEIDRIAMQAYKANLRMLSGRYGDLERRVLDYFVRHPAEDEITIDRSHALLLQYLVEDGMLEQVGHAKGTIWLDTQGAGPNSEPATDDVVLGPALWRLTDHGREVVSALRGARVVD